MTDKEITQYKIEELQKDFEKLEKRINQLEKNQIETDKKVAKVEESKNFAVWAIGAVGTLILILVEVFKR